MFHDYNLAFILFFAVLDFRLKAKFRYAIVLVLSVFVVLDLVLFSSKPRDWLGRTSPK